MCQHLMAFSFSKSNPSSKKKGSSSLFSLYKSILGPALAATALGLPYTARPAFAVDVGAGPTAMTADNVLDGNALTGNALNFDAGGAVLRLAGFDITAATDISFGAVTGTFDSNTDAALVTIGAGANSDIVTGNAVITFTNTTGGGGGNILALQAPTPVSPPVQLLSIWQILAF